MSTSTPNFNFLALLVSEIKQGVPKFNVGATSPLQYHVRWNFYVCSKYLEDQTACQISASYLYASCSYANMYFRQAFHLCPKMGFWGILRVNVWKYCVLTPKRHYPAWMLYRVSKSAWARSVERLCKHRKKEKNWMVTLGRSNICGDLDLTKCGVWGDMVDVITCTIFGDCRLS